MHRCRAPISISTNCFPHLPLAIGFQMVAAAGFDGVELVMGPEVWAGGARRIERLARQSGLRVFSIHVAVLPGFPAGLSHHLVPQTIDVALELAARVVVLHYPLNAADCFERHAGWQAALRAAAEQVRGSTTRLTLENDGTHHGRDGAAFLSVLRRQVSFAQQLGLDLTLDTCHMGSAGETLPEVLQLFRPRLRNVHLSDFRHIGAWARLPSLRLLHSHHQMPGSGCLQLTRFLRALAASGYADPVTAEVGPVANGGYWPPLMQRRLRRLQAFMRHNLG